MPRPRALEPMEERLELRMTRRQKAKLVRAAKRAGLDLGSWVRYVALRAAAESEQ